MLHVAFDIKGKIKKYLPIVNGQLSTVKRGQILILALVFMVVLTILILSLYSRLQIFLNTSKRSYTTEYTLNLADAGLDYALSRLNTNPLTWNGAATLIPLGIGEFEVSAIGCGAGSLNRCITATGYWPTQASPKYKQQAKAVAIPADTSQTIILPYAVQALDGGISLTGTYVKSNIGTTHLATAYTYGQLSSTLPYGKICGYGYGSNSIVGVLFGCNSGDGPQPASPYTQ